MKQILQSLRNGDIEVADIPHPSIGSKELLIKSNNSLISSGTEKMLIDFGKSGWLNKAKKQPDKVKMIFEKIKTDGVKPTLEAIFAKLNQPIPLGYCNVGEVVDVGSQVKSFKKGDRVVSNGSHAEVVAVPEKLCARIPKNVKDEEAVFTVISSIALQGIRLAKPELGEKFVVIGLGLIGLITIQILKANGCKVLGIDFDNSRIKLAEKFGADTIDLSKNNDPINYALNFTDGHGVDAVIITASTTSNEPVHQAAQMCRKRGRIVLTGVTGLSLSRSDFYEKEISFQVSCSYGPGRYDYNYENRGVDYPIGFVRWTEQRNFYAVLDLMQAGLIDLHELISNKFEIREAFKAYDLIFRSKETLGVILTYNLPSNKIVKDRSQIFIKNHNRINKNKTGVSFIGTGNYASRVLIPLFAKEKINLQIACSKSGVSSSHTAKKYKFQSVTTSPKDIFSDKDTDIVVISTRHNSHADLVIKSLKSKKHIFVEKPLCLKLDELDEIKKIYYKNKSDLNNNQVLMVGFNRRFSPHIKTIKGLIDKTSAPKAFVMTVNSGQVPSEDWTQNLEIGGGRVKGELCHFLDLLRYLAGQKIVSWNTNIMESQNNDSLSLQLSFEDGSIGTILYLSNGSKSFPKERLEVFTSGKILQLDNFKKLSGFGWKNFKNYNLWNQDKGQKNCINSFIESTKTGLTPISADEIFEISKLIIDIAENRS